VKSHLLLVHYPCATLLLISLFACLISSTFSANEQYFSLIINQRTVLSAMFFRPSEQGRTHPSCCWQRGWSLNHARGGSTNMASSSVCQTSQPASPRIPAPTGPGSHGIAFASLFFCEELRTDENKEENDSSGREVLPHVRNCLFCEFVHLPIGPRPRLHVMGIPYSHGPRRKMKRILQWKMLLRG
jgi:hypothetical protein